MFSWISIQTFLFLHIAEPLDCISSAPPLVYVQHFPELIEIYLLVLWGFLKGLVGYCSKLFFSRRFLNHLIASPVLLHWLISIMSLNFLFISLIELIFLSILDTLRGMLLITDGGWLEAIEIYIVVLFGFFKSLVGYCSKLFFSCRFMNT